MRAISSSRIKRNLTPVLFLIPGLLLFIFFVIGPMIYSFRISFFEWNVVRPELSTWVGLSNYLEALRDEIFQRAVLNTFAYTLITVPGQMILGLIVALLLDEKIKGRGMFRFLYYLPVVTSWVIVSLLFEYLFSGQAGLVNYFLRDVFHLVKENIRWLADPILVFVPINLLGIWKGIGWTALIYLAGLQAIPNQLYEAAEVDGAGSWQRFRYITLPLLRPTLVFLLVVLTIGGLNAYISNLLITNGGDPLDLTHFVLTLMYEATFSRLDFGMGSAISYLLTIIIFILSFFQLRLLRSNSDV